MRKLVLVGVVAAICAAQASAVGTRWVTVASATGEASADASATVTRMRSLGLRVSSSKPIEVNWSFYCSGKTTIPAGSTAVRVVTPAVAHDCNFSAYGNTRDYDSVPVRLTLMKAPR